VTAIPDGVIGQRGNDFRRKVAIECTSSSAVRQGGSARPGPTATMRMPLGRKAFGVEGFGKLAN